MLDKSSGQLFTIVMSDKQLKENFMRDFVKFLEYQVFYKYVQVLWLLKLMNSFYYN